MPLYHPVQTRPVAIAAPDGQFAQPPVIPLLTHTGGKGGGGGDGNGTASSAVQLTNALQPAHALFCWVKTGLVVSALELLVYDEVKPSPGGRSRPHQPCPP